MTAFALILIVGALSAASPGERRLEHAGESRLYLIDAPKPREGKKWPIIIALHGGGGNAAGFRAQTQFDKLGAGREFIAVHPEGYAKRVMGKSLAAWNAGSCCGLAREKNIDDVGFIAKLIDRLIAENDADPRRVYVTGHSNGGMMAYRLACEIPGKIAAIAPVGSPTQADTCVQNTPMPVLIVHGAEDACANYGGGKDCGGCFQKFLGLPLKGGDSGPCEPVGGHAARWAAAQGCGKTPIESRIGPALRRSYADCRAPVLFDTVRGHGHGWPGIGNEESSAACRRRPDGVICRRWLRIIGHHAEGYSASAEVWKFFKDKKR